MLPKMDCCHPCTLSARSLHTLLLPSRDNFFTPVRYSGLSLNFGDLTDGCSSLIQSRYFFNGEAPAQGFSILPRLFCGFCPRNGHNIALSH